jgi:hypothetical protein
MFNIVLSTGIEIAVKSVQQAFFVQRMELAKMYMKQQEAKRNAHKVFGYNFEYELLWEMEEMVELLRTWFQIEYFAPLVEARKDHVAWGWIADYVNVEFLTGFEKEEA